MAAGTRPRSKRGWRCWSRRCGRRQVGPYQLQAAIAACHARAGSAADTDWREIAGLYALLEGQMPSPVVRLNRAVAVAMAGDIEAGLAIVDELGGDARLEQYYLLEATRADLLRRRGDLACRRGGL